MLGNTLFKYFDNMNNLKTYGFLRNKRKNNKNYKYFNNNRIVEKNIIESNNLFLLLNEYKPKIIINCVWELLNRIHCQLMLKILLK